jgi:hypothetical protein
VCGDEFAGWKLSTAFRGQPDFGALTEQRV